MATSIYINIYKDNPTAGATDGTVVSIENTFTSPIQFDLDAGQNETKTMTCAVKDGDRVLCNRRDDSRLQ